MTKSAKSTLLWGGVLLAIVASVLIVVRYSEPQVSGNVNAEAGEIAEGDWIDGNPDADVVLIEYSDFQCPACRSTEPRVKSVLEEYGDDIAFVYRHFPLRSIHRNAERAAQAAEAAGLQGQFWEMHDKLFEQQSLWGGQSDPTAMFVEYAEELGLNVQQFEEDLDSTEVRQAVADDLAVASSAGLNSTPTFYLNGEPLKNPASEAVFKQIIEDAINGVE